MRIFKTKLFEKWARKESIKDEALRKAVTEIATGLCEASLGGHLYKKRVPLAGKGKRGGYRTILAFKHTSNSFFIYGFAKNSQSNICENEEKALKAYAKLLINYSDQEISDALASQALYEVKS